jgi:uncharacterized membrane protein YvbJ
MLGGKPMTEEIKQEQPATDPHKQENQPITLKEKIAAAVLIAYVISLIWLAGSKHWFGLW